MKVHWATSYDNATGNSLGYQSHNDRMKAALAATGVEFDESAPVAVHVCPPHHFEPIAGKRSIVSCAWEFSEFPPEFERLRDAAMVMPTATFLIHLFRNLLPGIPVEHLPLGVDCDTFGYVDRWSINRRPFYGNRPFRFLFLNGPAARKGPLHALQAWKVFERNPRAELYYKTTVDPGGDPPSIQRIGNVIYDTRKLPVSELVNLYHSAHCYLNPSQGEGFGLCHAEAAATGLPVIYTAATAMLDLAPPHMEVGYPVRWHPRKQWMGPHDSTPGDTAPHPGDHRDILRMWVTSANPSVDHLAELMVEVFKNPKAAFERGKRAAGRMRKHFTWESTGRRLRMAVEQLYSGMKRYGTEATASG